MPRNFIGSTIYTCLLYFSIYEYLLYFYKYARDLDQKQIPSQVSFRCCLILTYWYCSAQFTYATSSSVSFSGLFSAFTCTLYIKLLSHDFKQSVASAGHSKHLNSVAGYIAMSRVSTTSPLYRLYPTQKLMLY